jgi:hypothetical protein
MQIQYRKITDNYASTMPIDSTLNMASRKYYCEIIATYSYSGSPSLHSISPEVVENFNSERGGDVIYVTLNALWGCPVTHDVFV